MPRTDSLPIPNFIFHFQGPTNAASQHAQVKAILQPYLKSSLDGFDEYYAFVTDLRDRKPSLIQYILPYTELRSGYEEEATGFLLFQEIAIEQSKFGSATQPSQDIRVQEIFLWNTLRSLAAGSLPLYKSWRRQHLLATRSYPHAYFNLESATP